MVLNSLGPPSPVNAQFNVSSVRGFQSTTLMNVQYLVILLGLLFISWVLFTIPMCGKAWQYSTHTAGTTVDADFWFLMQTSTTQAVSRIVSAYSLWNKTSLPLYIWSTATALGFVPTVLSPVLYLYCPTEYSAFAGIVASASQSFMVLLLAFVNE